MQEVASIIIKIPDHLGIDEVEAKKILAAGLYRKGKLTLGQAAEFMGLTKRSFIELLGLYGYDLIYYPPKELENDLGNARKFCQ
jgi:predicted HTH domain antitoxin